MRATQTWKAGSGMIRNLRLRLRTLAAADNGNALIELAIAAPIIAIVLTGVLDVGGMAYTSMTLQSAARSGAQYAMKNPTDTAGIAQTVISSSGLNPQQVTVTSNNFCECANGASVACGGVCADGGPNRAFVSVAVQQSYRTLLPYPGMPDQFGLSGESIFRIQ